MFLKSFGSFQNLICLGGYSMPLKKKNLILVVNCKCKSSGRAFEIASQCTALSASCLLLLWLLRQLEEA